jgi:hypothetical protein
MCCMMNTPSFERACLEGRDSAQRGRPMASVSTHVTHTAFLLSNVGFDTKILAERTVLRCV